MDNAHTGPKEYYNFSKYIKYFLNENKVNDNPHASRFRIDLGT